jgi:hypothetical protein
VAPAVFSIVRHGMSFLELDAFAASVLRQELYTVGLECFTDRSHGVLVRLAYLAFKVANCPDADASLLFQLGLSRVGRCRSSEKPHIELMRSRTCRPHFLAAINCRLAGRADEVRL